MMVRLDAFDEEELPEPPMDFYLTLWTELETQGDRNIYWILDPEYTQPDGSPLEACSDASYLEDPEAENQQVVEVKRRAARSRPGSRVCQMKQASVQSNGDVDIEGWYYTEPANGRREIRFTDGVPNPPGGVTITTLRSIAHTIARDGDVAETDPDVCSLPEDSAEHENDVGRACLPSATVDGDYIPSEHVVELGSRQCGTGACLVYQLDGAANPPCGKTSEDPACRQQRLSDGVRASEEEIKLRAYCSCRCDAPEGDPGELCTCKDGFSCVPTLLDAPPGIRGSYCVRDGTFNTSY